MKRLSLLLLMVWVFESNAMAQNAIGWVTSKSGEVNVSSSDAPEIKPLALSQEVFLGQTIATGSKSAARLLLKGDNVITISENSKLKLTQYLVSPQKTESSFELLVGRIRAAVSARLLAQRGDFFEIRTRNAVAGVRGSQLGVSYDADNNQTQAGCGAGDCYMTFGGQTISIPVGQIITAVGNQLGSLQNFSNGQPGSYDPNAEFDTDGRSGEDGLPGQRGSQTGGPGDDQRNQNLDRNRPPRAPHDPFEISPDRYFRFLQNIMNSQRTQPGSGANIGNDGSPTGSGTTRGPGE